MTRQFHKRMRHKNVSPPKLWFGNQALSIETFTESCPLGISPHRMDVLASFDRSLLCLAPLSLIYGFCAEMAAVLLTSCYVLIVSLGNIDQLPPRPILRTFF